ncbi:MAG TPA: FkbM family methyltransferase [Solirubrobacter sp.]|nr:FkbM family methyltransferase [Solirubrobacter sp.]
MRRRLFQLISRLGWTVRRLGRRAVVVSAPGGPAVEKPVPGLVLLRAGDWRPAEQALHEHMVHEHVADLLRRRRVNCVIDVGANRGQYALALRRAGYAGRIVSFEPVPATFAELEAAADGDPRWTVRQCALGAADGTTTINAVHGTMSSLLAPTAFGARRYPRLRAPAPVEVPLRRLDGLLDELLAGLEEPRPFLKLDTQGYDLEAFAGLGPRTAELAGLQSELSVMPIYEAMPAMAEALAAFEAAGFALTALHPVSREDATGRVIEFDCVMVRP